MSGASAPILERCARLEGLFPLRASERVGRGAVRAHERERGAASVTRFAPHRSENKAFFRGVGEKRKNRNGRRRRRKHRRAP
eukprot:scaffold11034_cov45-Phaeocystis_antarctica.AAC.1